MTDYMGEATDSYDAVKAHPGLTENPATDHIEYIGYVVALQFVHRDRMACISCQIVTRLGPGHALAQALNILATAEDLMAFVSVYGVVLYDGRLDPECDNPADTRIVPMDLKQTAWTHRISSLCRRKTITHEEHMSRLMMRVVSWAAQCSFTAPEASKYLVSARVVDYRRLPQHIAAEVIEGQQEDWGVWWPGKEYVDDLDDPDDPDVKYGQDAIDDMHGDQQFYGDDDDDDDDDEDSDWNYLDGEHEDDD